MMSHCTFAYLKPQAGESPYYVHVTLNDQTQHMKVYYHQSYWKMEAVASSVFTYWIEQFRRLDKQLVKPTGQRAKSGRSQSIEVKGTCRVHSAMLKDIIGFIEKDTCAELPAKVECYANAVTKMIEITLDVPYSSMGQLHREMKKLPVFTVDPNIESVRARLPFFKMTYIVTDSTSPVSTPPPNGKHSGSPALVPLSHPVDDHKEEITLDPPFGEAVQPYGYPLQEDVVCKGVQ
jgi:hypothetical protein